MNLLMSVSLAVVGMVAAGGTVLISQTAGGTMADVGKLPAPRNELNIVEGDEAPDEISVVLAGGCFWCTEAVFEQINGVKDVVSGYAGGSEDDAVYEQVAAGKTDHAEAIRITYDPDAVSYGTILRIFFNTHDPTQLNRQGPDVGKQYRSAVFYGSAKEKAAADAYIEQLSAAAVFEEPIVTALEQLDAFHPAESYHQDFVERNPGNRYVQVYALPKVNKVRELYPELIHQDDSANAATRPAEPTSQPAR